MQSLLESPSRRLASPGVTSCRAFLTLATGRTKLTPACLKEPVLCPFLVLISFLLRLPFLPLDTGNQQGSKLVRLVACVILRIPDQVTAPVRMVKQALAGDVVLVVLSVFLVLVVGEYAWATLPSVVQVKDADFLGDLVNHCPPGLDDLLRRLWPGREPGCARRPWRRRHRRLGSFPAGNRRLSV